MNHFGENIEDFEEYIVRFKNKVNTIADLRSLWLQKQTRYAKVLRVLSQIYVRKHFFGHIFNSRIENYKKHIKYRYKILQGLRKPEEFTQLKDF